LPQRADKSCAPGSLTQWQRGLSCHGGICPCSENPNTILLSVEAERDGVIRRLLAKMGAAQHRQRMVARHGRLFRWRAALAGNRVLCQDAGALSDRGGGLLIDLL
jgi:hypothetical protein